MADDLPALLAEVTRIAPGLHKAGTFSPTALAALARHAAARPLTATAETGSGASTLLLSHLSNCHTVFAMDAGTGSIRAIEHSPLLRPGVVTFVEGPTQLTLPTFQFPSPLQLVLIDGPHGYPFPDLEYYYLYPRLETGALLVVDDIQIPTIGNLFDFLRADEMFALVEVVQTTAFFRRTPAPVFSPLEDGWWLQGYNKHAFVAAPPQLVNDNDAVRIEGSAPFHIDRFGSATDPTGDDTVRLSSLDDIEVSGWAIDPPRRRAAEAVDLVINETTYRLTPRAARGDVAQAFGSHDYLRCGFTATFAAGTFAPGAYDVEVRIVVQDGRRFVLGGRLRLVLA